MPAGPFLFASNGEICIYGINEIPKMTQITSQELAKVVCPQAQKTALFSAGISGLEAALIFAVFLSGVGAGKYLQKPRLRVSSPPPDSVN
jgi:hypothetical protein